MRNNSENKKGNHNPDVLGQRIKVIEKGLTKTDREELWNKIKTAAYGRKNISFFKRFLPYIVAACLGGAVAVYSYMFYLMPASPSIDYLSLAIDTLETIQDNVTVILPDQKKIEVDDKDVELVCDTQGRMKVNTKVIEPVKPVNNRLQQELTQVVVPYGKTTRLQLSDGTRIWINSGSRVIYPLVFNDKRREIFVDGEAYLEVAHNEQIPFIVKTDLLEITVQGTAFNVSAYKNDNDYSVILATGSVSVKEASKKAKVTIKPNQKYTYDRTTQTSDLQNVDVLNYISWKEGFLYFRNESLSDVLKKVERYYNIPLDYDPIVLSRTTLSGKLDLKENIEETFRIIATTAPIDYVVRNDKIEINVKQ